MLIAQKHYIMTTHKQSTYTLYECPKRLNVTYSYLSASPKSIVKKKVYKTSTRGGKETIWITESSDGLGFEQNLFFYSVYV